MQLGCDRRASDGNWSLLDLTRLSDYPGREADQTLSVSARRMWWFVSGCLDVLGDRDRVGRQRLRQITPHGVSWKRRPLLSQLTWRTHLSGFSVICSGFCFMIIFHVFASLGFSYLQMFDVTKHHSFNFKDAHKSSFCQSTSFMTVINASWSVACTVML